MSHRRCEIWSLSHLPREKRRVTNNSYMAKGTGADSSWESGKVPAWTLREGQDLRWGGRGGDKQEGGNSSRAGAGHGRGCAGLETQRVGAEAQARGSWGKQAGPPGERL